MPFRDSLQPNRFELKYIVNESCAAVVRDFVRNYLEPDPYADPEHGNSYLLASLYLDTPDLSLYQQTVRGEKNRFKLRIRFYDDNPSSPALLEIKRRVTNVILKERAVVTRDSVREFLDDRAPDPSWLMGGTEDVQSGNAMMHFCSLVDRIGAGPSIYVVYRREAYVSPESNSVRVTFDRQLLGSPYEPGTDLRLPPHGVRPDIGNNNKVVLELKFTDRFPEWMHELAQLFNLQRTSVPKYILCINKLGIKPGMLPVRGTGNGRINPCSVPDARYKHDKELLMSSSDTPQSPPPDKKQVKAALKAFKKRLKLTCLDDQSRIGVGPLSGGNASSIVGITPPDQYPKEVWEELVRQGRLKKSGSGQYSLVQQ